MKDPVLIKSNKYGITIYFDPDMPYEELLPEVRDCLLYTSLLVDSMAWKVSIVINHAFCKACHCHHRLVGRTWSRFFLRRVIIEWPGLIGHQLAVIIGIHGIGKPVIVVSGIGYALSLIHI